MSTLAYVVLGLAVALGVYTYAGYPLLLAALARRRPPPPAVATDRTDWPLISITIPAYNEAGRIGATLRALVAADYPADRRQILVVSDASTDGTDDVVREFAAQGVELVRLPARGGKTAAENAALPLLRGAIVVNLDASIAVAPPTLRRLVAAFDDPSVGVASGRDVSVGSATDANGEAGYVGYEMWVRELETRAGGIVGASGCCYAIRAELHRTALAPDLSRDFAAALIAREPGFRAVSVPEALCYVARTPALRDEYRRKVRTMARGMRTLRAKRALLNPLRGEGGGGGTFAWMLFSHKMCRWLVPWAALAAVLALAVLAGTAAWARWLILAAGGVSVLAALGWSWPRGRPVPKLLAVPAYLISGNVAALVAALQAMASSRHAVWEPTHRVPVVQRSDASS